MKDFGPKCYRYVDLEKAVAGGQDMLSPYQAMGNNPVSSMDPGGSAYYSMENYVDNRGNRFYLSPGTIASLGLPWTGDPTGFTPPPSWDYGAFFDLSADIVTFQFYSAGYARLQKVIQQRKEDKKNEKEEHRAQEIFKAIVAFYDEYGNHDEHHASYGSGDGSGVGGITARNFPSSGFFTEGNVTYNLASFNQFYLDYGQKFQANYINARGNVFYFDLISNLTLDGKPFKAFAEAEAYLTIQESLLGPHVWLSVGAPLAGKGTSNIFNEVYSQDAFVPANHSSTTIHTHPPAGRLGFDYNGLSTSPLEGIPGPSRNDYPASFLPYRNVIVDPNYIYLFNSHPDQTIIFNRP